MASQCSLWPPTYDALSRSPFCGRGNTVLGSTRRRVSSVSCVCACVSGGNDEGWHLPSTFMRSTAVFMFASFALGIRAASASTFFSSSQVEPPGYECFPSTDEGRLSMRCRGSRGPDSQNEDFWTTPRKFMEAQTMEACNCVEGDRDNLYIFPRNVPVHNTQDALPTPTVPEKKFAFDEGSEDWERGNSGPFADSGKDTGKPFHKWDASFKLTVPLKIVSLRGSLPSSWLKDFLLSQGKRVRFSIQYLNSLNDIMVTLRLAKEKKDVKPTTNSPADLVTIGDSWLPLAVSRALLQPIQNAEQQEWFKRLGTNWQAFVRRDQHGGLDPKGPIWGVPYRWGCMVIAYKKDPFLKNNIPAIEDWKDLWRPELKGQIAMVDSPREVVGAVLKSLGASYNAQDFDQDVEGGRVAVKQKFLTLQNQVKVFDSVHYLKAFGSDDVWVAVGWSNDVIPVAKRLNNVRVVTPKSGVSLWADLWAVPVASSRNGVQAHAVSPLIHQWLDFCLQPARGLSFQQGIFVGASPLSFSKVDIESKGSSTDNLGKTTDITVGAIQNTTRGPSMDTNMLEGMPPQDCLENSEMLQPLSEKAVAEYRWLFSEV